MLRKFIRKIVAKVGYWLVDAIYFVGHRIEVAGNRIGDSVIDFSWWLHWLLKYKNKIYPDGS